MNQADLLSDDFVCMVVFDIPEKFREQRRLLRRFLEDNVFVAIQKSVWISQFGVADFLVKFFKRQKMDKWVRVFLAKER